jgi:1-deoxy-D-xylulose-5-phosphate synthase
VKKTDDPHKTNTPLLDSCADLSVFRNLSLSQLEELCAELRQETIEVVSKIGGHLGAGLGVIELTVALHYVFNTPEDLLVWDVGHQAYPHKILTGRRNKITTLRQKDGLAGFTRRAESIFDPFGAGHSSTSISAALGMAVGRDLAGSKKEVIAVIGDGAMSAGMAYEAMNNAGSAQNRLIVILNDNDMSIAPPVGALSAYLSRLISSSPYLSFRNLAKQVLSHLPKPFEHIVKKAEQCVKETIASKGNFFEEMGFYYIGAIDGHNLSHLLPVLKNIKEDHTIDRPVLIHIVTEKGKGFDSSEGKEEKFHAVNKFDLNTYIQEKAAKKKPSYTQIFAESLTTLAEKDDKIVAITAAMPSGTGLNLFAKQFPERCFDVGIAEQHAVTFAAGLACEGFKPYVAIYSTFLQRAYDQIIHDVALQKLPVRFAIDRAGLVGADGPTHAGSYDIAFLSCLPNMIIMAASDATELQAMVRTSALIDDAPCAFRYPRGDSKILFTSPAPEFIEIGKGRIIKEGERVAILSLGHLLPAALEASELLAAEHLNITVADARFAKPLDYDLINKLIQNHDLLITLEAGSVGGFGAHVLEYVASKGILPAGFKIRTLTLPDEFIEHHHNINEMYQTAGLSSSAIVNLIKKSLSIKNHS